AGQGQQILAVALGLEQGSDVIGRVELRRHCAEPEDDVGRLVARAVPWQERGQFEIGFELERCPAEPVAHAAEAANGIKPCAVPTPVTGTSPQWLQACAVRSLLTLSRAKPRWTVALRPRRRSINSAAKACCRQTARNGT